MPLLLRCIKNKRHWDEINPPWLPAGDIPADPLGDLVTKHNGLSVWHIEDDRSNIERVVTALAAARDKPDPCDYVLFDVQLLSQVGITIVTSQGGTPDAIANDRWHRDLVEISACKLLRLAKLMYGNAKTRRESTKNIKNWIEQAISSGQVDVNKLNAKMRENLGLFERH